MNMPLPEPRLKAEGEPFIPYVPEQAVVERLGSVVGPYIQRMGFLPNALKLYAHRPEIAETLFSLNSKIMRDPTQTLDQGLKRRLSVIASYTNGCTYCTAHCCAILRKPTQAGSEGWGMSAQDLYDLISGSYRPASALEAACIAYVRAASENPSNVPDGVLEDLRRHLTPPQIVELACLVGFWKFYNTVHDSLHIPLEEHLLQDSGWVDV